MFGQVWIRDDQKSKMAVYQIRCMVDGRVYVGSTDNFDRRQWAHKSLLRKGRHHSYRLQMAWNEFGCGALVWEILEYVYDPDLLLVLEDEYIKRLKSANRRFGFNLRPSSDRNSEESCRRISEANWGKEKTDEHKQKLSEALRGRKYSEETLQKMRGKKLSGETRQKMSEAHKGTKHTEETRQKMSNAHKGKKHTGETRQKMSEGRIGRKHTEETKQKLRESRIRRIQQCGMEVDPNTFETEKWLRD